MGYILNIETATKNCSVSLFYQTDLVGKKELNNGNYSHAEVLHVFIQELFDSFNVNATNLDAVAVSKGPGSYTGLRIGVSAAKGLCFALDVPLISINTLKSLACSITMDEGLIVPMIDARRLEVYTALFNSNYQEIETTQAEVITGDSFKAYLDRGPVHFLGDGSEKCKPIITHENAIFHDNHYPSAIQMGPLSYEKYKRKEFEDVAYFEPFYLKDFIAVPEKKRKPTF